MKPCSTSSNASLSSFFLRWVRRALSSFCPLFFPHASWCFPIDFHSLSLFTIFHVDESERSDFFSLLTSLSRRTTLARFSHSWEEEKMRERESFGGKTAVTLRLSRTRPLLRNKTTTITSKTRYLLSFLFAFRFSLILVFHSSLTNMLACFVFFFSVSEWAKYKHSTTLDQKKKNDDVVKNFVRFLVRLPLYPDEGFSFGKRCCTNWAKMFALLIGYLILPQSWNRSSAHCKIANFHSRVNVERWPIFPQPSVNFNLRQFSPLTTSTNGDERSWDFSTFHLAKGGVDTEGNGERGKFPLGWLH